MGCTMVKANTVGTIAEQIQQPLHVVEYIIRARNIQPVLRAGNARVFDDAAVAQIEREIKTMRRNKTRESVSA